MGVAGLGEIVLGPVESAAACESGFWLWEAADNLWLAAQNAIEIAEGRIDCVRQWLQVSHASQE